MLVESEKLFRKVSSSTREEALRNIAGILAENEIASLKIAGALDEQDRNFSCILGSIAVPHIGVQDTSLLCTNSGGVAALFSENPIDWNGVKVHLVLGVACPKSLQTKVFTAIATLSERNDLVELLSNAERVSDILTLLNAPPVEERIFAGNPSGKITDSHDAMKTVRIVDPNGMHARPAAKLAKLAADFSSDILLIFNGKSANIQSVGALMGLGLVYGSEIQVAANGSDANDAVETIAGVIAQGLDREAEAENVSGNFLDLPSFTPSANAVHGLPASPGIGIGPIYFMKEHTTVCGDIPEDGEAPEAERKKLESAWEKASLQLATLKKQMNGTSSAIFEAHESILADTELRSLALRRIQEGKSAAFAWFSACNATAEQLRLSGNSRIMERAIDYRDVSGRVLNFLLPNAVSETDAEWPDHEFILGAEDLTPSQTAQLPEGRILAIVTAQGAPTAHTSILARSLGIPCVVAAGCGFLSLKDGTPVIVNGTGGFLEVTPDEILAEKAKQVQTEDAERRRKIRSTALEPVVSRDGVPVEIAANITSAADAVKAVECGADGIGLLRTEIMIQDCDETPTEELIAERLGKVAEALSGRRVIVRTYDIGGDKPVPFMPLEKEENPFLGVRGIRLCFEYPDVFRTQIRGILKAMRDHTLNAEIMFPMITSLDELRKGRAIVKKEAEALNVSCPRIGIMIEVPSVIFQIEDFVKEADFFSIGTNDLTQYILATDRLHPKLAATADSFHPAVLRAIAYAVKKVKQHGVWIGVCGNLASELAGAAFLFGIGVDELSVAAPSIAEIKDRIRNSSREELFRLAERAICCKTTEEVKTLYSK